MVKLKKYHQYFQRAPAWKRRLITKSSIATVKETQVFVTAVRRGEVHDLHTAFLVFQLFDSYS